MPSIVISIVATYRVFEALPRGDLAGDDTMAFGDPFAVYQDPVYIAALAVSWALFGLSIYLIVKWSREHNQKFQARPESA